MSVSYTDRRGLVPARVKQGEPWPVDPAKYPLSGPSRGPAYTPPDDYPIRDAVHQMLIMYACFAALWFCGFAALGLIASLAYNWAFGT